MPTKSRAEPGAMRGVVRLRGGQPNNKRRTSTRDRVEPKGAALQLCEILGDWKAESCFSICAGIGLLDPERHEYAATRREIDACPRVFDFEHGGI